MEIAESEFLSLKKIRTDYQRSVAIQVEAKVPDLPVDPVSLRSLIEQEPLVAEIDKAIATLWGVGVSKVVDEKLAELMSGATRRAGMTKLQDVRNSLARFRTGVIEYVRRYLEFLPEPRSPSPVAKGVSILNLAMMLNSVHGVEAAEKALRPFGVVPIRDVARQVAIAREIVAKHRG